MTKMTISSLDKAYEEIYKVFDKVTPTGRLSKVKSNHIRAFLCVAVCIGLEKIKDENPKVFNRYIKDLEKCGITEEFIREEFEKQQFKNRNKKVEFVELKFSNETPADYIYPKSTFSMDNLKNDSEKS